MSASPRRALAPEPRGGVWGSPRSVLLGFTVAAILLVASSLLVWGPRGAGEAAVPVPGAVGTDGGRTSASPPNQVQSSGAPTALPTSSPAGTPSVGDPSPGTTPLIELNDTSLTVPQGWVVYADETIEGDRRLVHLRQGTDDTRIQVVTLVTTDPDLTTSCRALVTSQVSQFTHTTELLTLSIGLAPEVGEGRTCGFTGVRTSDGTANSVSFTLVRRASDGHVLMLRQTIPDAVGIDSQSRRDLSGMTCEASAGFGVPLPLC